ncbi:hypothetical protein Tco_0499579 [Tanacetum coccineum]
MRRSRIRLEEEKARRRGKVYNWETATYGKIWDNEDVHDLGSVETEFPAIVFNDTLTSEAALSCEPTISRNKFPSIVYNDAQTSKSDLLTEPILNPQHIDKFNLKDETSLSECDEEEQNVLNFNDLFLLTNYQKSSAKIIREVFVKLLLDSFGKLSISGLLVVSVTVSLLWIVDSECDRLIIVRFDFIIVMIERERLNVD